MKVMKYIHDKLKNLIEELSEVLKGVDIQNMNLQDLIDFVILHKSEKKYV